MALALRYSTLPEQEANTAACVAAYARRRTWSRTDTARWLNERSAPVLAHLRRRPGKWPAHSRSVGYWLKEDAPAVFDAAHARLLAARDDAAREILLPQTILS